MDNKQTTAQIWPPAYSLKKHPRAKHIRFRASLDRGLELIVPPRFNAKYIPELLERNRAWIEKKLSELQLQSPPMFDILPEQLEFAAINAKWQLQYLPSDTRLRLLARPQQELVLIGDIQAKSACQKKLLSWVKGQAKEHLLSQLEQLSLQTGLSFSKATIRSQSTRWGSCSKSGAINLNYKLLFLPQALAQHVMLHELCHTVHFNHSDRFWGLLASFDTNWKEHRRALKRADSFVPQWLRCIQREV